MSEAPSPGMRVAIATSGEFGTTLVDRIVPSYFSGRADRTISPEGVHYVLEGTISPSDD